MSDTFVFNVVLPEDEPATQFVLGEVGPQGPPGPEGPPGGGGLSEEEADALYAALTDPRLSDERTPTDGSVTDIKVAADAAIAQAKIANLVADLTARLTEPEADALYAVLAHGHPAPDLSAHVSHDGTPIVGDWLRVKSIAPLVVERADAPEGGGGGAMELIARVELLALQVTVTFDNIPQTYEDLRLVASVRSRGATVNEGLSLRLNNDAANNYDMNRIWYSSTLASANQRAATSAQIGVINGMASPPEHFSQVILDLTSYAVPNRRKSWASVSSSPSDGVSLWLQQAGGTWRGLDAVTQIDLLSPPHIEAGSIFKLYGIKGA